MLALFASRMDLIGDCDGVYQKSSREPVELAPMMRSGAPREKAPNTPDVPALSPMSTELETTSCSVSPPPDVEVMSRSIPYFWKIPFFLPSSEIALSQLPRCGEAIFRVSASATCGCIRMRAAKAAQDGQRTRIDILPWRELLWA